MRGLRLLLLVWVAIFAWSIAALWVLEPVGDGFTRGMNRVTQLVLWQFWAAIVAFVISIRARRLGRTAWVWRVPLWLAGGFAILVLAVLLLPRAF